VNARRTALLSLVNFKARPDGTARMQGAIVHAVIEKRGQDSAGQFRVARAGVRALPPTNAPRVSG